MEKLLVVQIRRSGGVAGIPRTAHREFNTQVPPIDDGPWLRVAFGALEQLRGLQEAPGNSLARDTFTWFFSFNGEEHLVPDAQLTGPARELAEHLIGPPRRRGSERADLGDK